jgi:hypothetical protein
MVLMKSFHINPTGLDGTAKDFAIDGNQCQAIREYWTPGADQQFGLHSEQCIAGEIST